MTHLKAVEGAVVFEGEHVVWDGEEVPLSRDEAPDVHGLGCDKDRSEEHRSQRVPRGSDTKSGQWNQN